MSETNQVSFEEALLALEEIVTQLEAGDQNLEKSLALFEEGQRLVAMCNNQLAEATLRVEQLTADGEIVALS